jgi:hypothetical protein
MATKQQIPLETSAPAIEAAVAAGTPVPVAWASWSMVKGSAVSKRIKRCSSINEGAAASMRCSSSNEVQQYQRQCFPPDESSAFSSSQRYSTSNGSMSMSVANKATYEYEWSTV